MISRNLATAIVETLQQHADRYHRGVMDLDRTLSAIGEVASGLLAELTTTDDRASHYSALVDGIAHATACKIGRDQRHKTPQ
jgi:hypothetical protein